MRKVVLVVIFFGIVVGSSWGVVHFVRARRLNSLPPIKVDSVTINSLEPDAWFSAIEKVKSDRAGEQSGPLEIPTELRHYSDRHWFLATQVAEVTKHNVRNCQDYFELAGMIQRGELVGVPAVTETFVLFGIGAKADDSEFTKFDGEQTIQIYSEQDVHEAYKRLDDQRIKLQNEIQSLKNQANRLNQRERRKQSELQKQISNLEQQLTTIDDQKQRLDKTYGQPDAFENLKREHESLENLARNFNGRSFDLNSASDRLALKVNMLSTLRPEALKVLEEIAAIYHQKYNRPLPISSLVRPEQYQHALRRVNRNAVLIDTPPHSTGLAFDIDYRYMTAGEQTFLMASLAELKRAGRIEVIRETNANYHVFAFIDGTRPSDDLITASLDKASTEVQDSHHATAKPQASKSKQQDRKKRVASTKKHRH